MKEIILNKFVLLIIVNIYILWIIILKNFILEKLLRNYNEFYNDWTTNIKN